MNDDISGSPKGFEDQLAKLGRYEALFELTGAINASTDIFEISQILARRLKYVADVFAWRYICVHQETGTAGQASPTAVIIDGFRGRGEMIAIDPESLSELETDLWQNPKARVLCEGPEDPGLASLPDHFRRSDISQIYAHPLLGGGKDRAVFLFCKRREPFNDLDLKFVALVSAFFHKRVFMLREREMLRELEVAYLDQEMTLRQSEKLATLGKMSAGMAHELNNPASAARRSAEQLREVIDTMQTARFHLGGLGLSEDQLEEVRLFEVAAIGLARRPDSLEPLERSDREEVMETWLDDRDVDDPWELAPSLVSMGQQPETLEHLAESFEAEEFDVVLQALASHFTVHRLLVEMGHGTNRIADIVGALKSYTYLDQAPVQEIDVREGLDDTLVMLNSKLKDGVSVERDYQEDLPRIEAHGSELKGAKAS
jgi:signal transduction histidine kinase